MNTQNNENKSEKIALWIAITIILVSIICVIFVIFRSNKGLSTNSYEQEKTEYDVTNESTNNSNVNNQNNSSTQETPNTTNSNNSSNLSNSDVDNVNITTNELPQQTETEIATYTSTLYDKDKNRVHNITLAISKLNNCIIKKGEEFSFNNTVGPMGEAQGFKKAVGFDSNGNKIKVAGGGMCQISSTIYNAALIAKLEITERHPHSRRVYYVPKDKDATVYYDTLDLKFKNNTENDIKLIASNDDKNVTIKLVNKKYESI